MISPKVQISISGTIFEALTYFNIFMLCSFLCHATYIYILNPVSAYNQLPLKTGDVLMMVIIFQVIVIHCFEQDSC